MFDTGQQFQILRPVARVQCQIPYSMDQLCFTQSLIKLIHCQAILTDELTILPTGLVDGPYFQQSFIYMDHQYISPDKVTIFSIPSVNLPVFLTISDQTFFTAELSHEIHGQLYYFYHGKGIDY